MTRRSPIAAALRHRPAKVHDTTPRRERENLLSSEEIMQTTLTRNYGYCSTCLEWGPAHEPYELGDREPCITYITGTARVISPETLDEVSGRRDL